jgi:hypothetical protein
MDLHYSKSNIYIYKLKYFKVLGVLRSTFYNHVTRHKVLGYIDFFN